MKKGTVKAEKLMMYMEFFYVLVRTIILLALAYILY